MKIYIDPGHGGDDSGATANGIKEKEIVLDIGNRLRNILEEQYRGVEVKMSRTTDVFRRLQQRTDEANAWDADLFISLHINSANGSAQGYEDYIFDGLTASSRSGKIQSAIHEEIVASNQLKNRGKKKGNFHVLRETKMSAVLTENGFIDHPEDASKMKDATWREKVAKGHADGIAKALDLQIQETTQPNPMYDLALFGSKKAILSSSDPSKHIDTIKDLLKKQVDGIQIIKRK